MAGEDVLIISKDLNLVANKELSDK